MLVIKASGELHEYNRKKIEDNLLWATQDEDFDFAAHIDESLFYDGISTRQINDILAKSLAHSGFNIEAGRIAASNLIKDVFGSQKRVEPYSMFAKTMVDTGYYADRSFADLSDDDWKMLDRIVDCEWDFTLGYSAIQQLKTKYLLRHRHGSKKVLETPSYAFAAIAVNAVPIQDVPRFYRILKEHGINLPTPMLAGLRSVVKQHSSCVLVDVDDDLDSIIAASRNIVKYASKRAGLGINIGRLRPQGSRVSTDGRVSTGLLPFLKYFYSSLSSVSQGGIRRASATVNYPVWHSETPFLINLKAEAGTSETRLREIDYCIHLNGHLLRRMVDDRPIHLVPSYRHENYSLYDSFYEKGFRFQDMYNEIGKDGTYKEVGGRDLLLKIATERLTTGRIYIAFADHMQRGPFNVPINMTNLCTEILLPTEPSYSDCSGETALCTLSSINVGDYDMSSSDWRGIMDENVNYAVMALNKVLDRQDYATESATVIRKNGDHWESGSLASQTAWPRTVSGIATRRRSTLLASLRNICNTLRSRQV